MELLIVTGMSGAGKSQAANFLEDMGYYCVDNIPPAIIPSFVDFSMHGSEDMMRLAIVTDIRGGDMFNDMPRILETLKNNNVDYKILFLDAPDDVLVRRFKENRRKHPLCERSDISVTEAVEVERGRLSEIRNAADYLLDTGSLSTADLKKHLNSLFLSEGKKGMSIICRSFGFKYGIDADADMVIDVRCLRNPFYVSNLKNKNGTDSDVSDYVMDSQESIEFEKKLFDFIDYSLNLYINEGKSQLVISFGCTGGKHRSVTFAERLFKHITEKGYKGTVIHRDMNKK